MYTVQGDFVCTDQFIMANVPKATFIHRIQRIHLRQKQRIVHCDHFLASLPAVAL